MFTGLSYSNHARNTLDVYPSDKPNAPVVFFIHGGGWSGGDKNMYGHIGRHFSKHGYCTVLINHRLSPEVKHPAHTEDAANAVIWTVKYIQSYGGDPGKINLMGHSSGAHIAALLCSNPQFLEECGSSPKSMNSFVGISGVYDVHLMTTLGGYTHVFLNPEDKSASPINFMPSCPVFLVYGENDFFSMPRQSQAFHEKIVGCEMAIAKEETHGSIVDNISDASKVHSHNILDFLSRHN